MSARCNQRVVSIYRKGRITFSAMNHLDSIGLVKFNNITEYILPGVARHWSASYHNRTLMLTMPQEVDNTLRLGYVCFTNMGAELSRISERTPIDGFLNMSATNVKADKAVAVTPRNT